MAATTSSARRWRIDVRIDAVGDEEQHESEHADEHDGRPSVEANIELEAHRRVHVERSGNSRNGSVDHG